MKDIKDITNDLQSVLDARFPRFQHNNTTGYNKNREIYINSPH